jgi:AraC family transcriptional regulator
VTTLADFGEIKFPDAGLLQASAGRGWDAIGAEVRSHPECDVPAICPDQMEITLAIRGNLDAQVERRGNGKFQSTTARSGTLWFCPIGVQEDAIRITGDLPKILHLYVPGRQFELLSEMSSRRVVPQDIFYLADVEDEFVRQIGLRIVRELEEESAGGRMLVEQMSLTLVAHLASTYSGDAPTFERERRTRGALDERRLERVRAYIEAHLDRNLTLGELAQVACLSRHHFARAFREATGTPPHRYISARRLERAQTLLADPTIALTDVALTSQFSSQASFTRAFQRHMGLSPGEYRRRSAN